MKTVLLTDDNADIVELVQLVLANSGYSMITAVDGEAAVQLGLEQKPDLILMDLKMPKMNGIDATRALRAKGFDKPIVVLTASESEEDKRNAMAAGCNGYILKTLDMDGVEQILDHYLTETGGMD